MNILIRMMALVAALLVGVRSVAKEEPVSRSEMIMHADQIPQLHQELQHSTESDRITLRFYVHTTGR